MLFRYGYRYWSGIRVALDANSGYRDTCIYLRNSYLWCMPQSSKRSCKFATPNERADMIECRIQTYTSLKSQNRKKRNKFKHQYSTNLCVFGRCTQIIWTPHVQEAERQKSKKRYKFKYQCSTNLCIFGRFTQIIRTPHIQEAKRQNLQAVKYCTTYGLVSFFYLYIYLYFWITYIYIVFNEGKQKP